MIYISQLKLQYNASSFINMRPFLGTADRILELKNNKLLIF